MTSESLENDDSARQANIDKAQVLAIMANGFFDVRLDLATRLTDVLSSGEAGLGVAEDEFEQSALDFELYRSAAETIMPPRTAFETTTEHAEPFSGEIAWNMMSAEQQAKAQALRIAVAAGPLERYGVNEDSLDVVMTEVSGQKQFTLIHKGNGIDLGNHKKPNDKARSYNSLMSSKNDWLFQIKIGGAVYDLRQGMTAEVYAAKVEYARMHGQTLPDSEQLSKETSDDWTWTILTGEGLNKDGHVMCRATGGNEVAVGAIDPNEDGRIYRICPAAAIV